MTSVRTDNRLADAPMTPVACRRCGAHLLVRKSTWNQTSVQWDAEAMSRCIERRRAAQLTEHGGRGLFLACSSLSDSIVDAVRHGVLSIVDELAANNA